MSLHDKLCPLMTENIRLTIQFMQALAKTWSVASQLVNNRCLDYVSMYADMYV